MALDTALLDGLLGDDVAGREEDRGGDALGEEGARRQASLVPGRCRQFKGASIRGAMTYQARTMIAIVSEHARVYARQKDPERRDEGVSEETPMEMRCRCVG